MTPSALSDGAVIAGRYTIAKPIGRGGMGVVYDAMEGKTSRAIKVMDPAIVDDPDRRARFEREARIGSLLKSPHVTAVLDHGVDDATGLPYLVMERLRGHDLAALVESRGRLPRLEARRLLAQLCEAVGTAHAAGIVHRDLKPNNVFVIESGDVKILDFGIAKVLDDWRGTSSIVMGTPGWMAPEQLDSAGKISAGTDVWAIGLLAFYVLTGKEYWTSSNTARDSWASLCREICVGPLAKASERAAAHGVNDLPDGFDAWFARCVVREPHERHPDAAAAGRALDSILKVKLIKTPVPPDVAKAPDIAPSGVLTMPVAGVQTAPPLDPEDEETAALAKASSVLSCRVRKALEKTKGAPAGKTQPTPGEKSKAPAGGPGSDPVVARPRARGQLGVWLLVLAAVALAIGYAAFAGDSSSGSPAPPPPVISLPTGTAATPKTTLDVDPLRAPETPGTASSPSAPTAAGW